MRLSTRLTILLITITTMVAVCVGWFAVNSSTKSQYASLDDTINAVVASGLGHPLSALSDALYVVQQNNYDLTLDVIDPSDSVTQINSGDAPLRRRPSLANVRDSLGAVSTAANLPGFRFRSLDVGGGAHLVVAGSTKEIAAQSHQLEERVALAGLLAAMAMAIVARLFIRRDLWSMRNLVSFAASVASGDDQAAIPPAAGSSDVRELRTSLAHMVNALQRTIEKEQDSTQTMQRFIGDASHELRTPLTVIKGYSEMLERPDISEEQKARALERVRREVGRMEALVNDLLFLAEVSETPSHDVARIDLSELVGASTRDFEHDNPARVVQSEIEPALYTTSRPDFLERLITNALNNIVRHTGSDVPVRVSLVHQGTQLVLCFEDGGPGLPGAAYDQQPERFQRFDDSRSRTSGGSGLGMSIMADVTTALGGTMSRSRSALGGLALTFTLPGA